MSSTPLPAGMPSQNEAVSPEVARNLALVTPPSGENATAKSSASQLVVVPGLVAFWVHDYWWSGIVAGLVAFDGLILLLALCDCLRFTLQGLSLADAWNFALEAENEAGFLILGVTVFALFLIVLPALSALLLAWIQHRKEKREDRSTHTQGGSSQLTPSSNTANENSAARYVPVGGAGHFLRRGGWIIFLLHLAATGCIAAFTVLAQGMETLSGWGRGEAYSYSFSSYWLHIVLYLRLAYPGYFLPVFRKFIVRAAGGEHPSFREVGREVLTEERLGGEH